jgi:hypothetical protein
MEQSQKNPTVVLTLPLFWTPGVFANASEMMLLLGLFVYNLKFIILRHIFEFLYAIGF